MLFVLLSFFSPFANMSTFCSLRDPQFAVLFVFAVRDPIRRPLFVETNKNACNNRSCRTAGHIALFLAIGQIIFLCSRRRVTFPRSLHIFFKDLNICFSTLFEINKREFKRKLITYQAAILFFNFHEFTYKNMYLLHASSCSKILTFI